MSDPADFRSARLPTLPKPGPRFYLRVRQGRARDQRVWCLVRVAFSNLDWLQEYEISDTWLMHESPKFTDDF